MTEPFMEHPAGEFDTAIAAMADAIQRLRALPAWDAWITFGAQGAGEGEEDCHIAEIRMRRDELAVNETLDAASIVRIAGVPASSFAQAGAHYSVAGATPAEVARILDAIFRHGLGIRPFPDEADDYAVGAEW